MDSLFQIGIFVGLMILGYFTGRYIETNHYKSIRHREKKHIKLPAVTFSHSVDWSEMKNAKLVVGIAVISIDYYKAVVGSIRSFFGGRVTAHESVMDRARREAVLRMKEEAIGFDAIENVRFETSTISDSSDKRIIGVEVIAYGTAVSKMVA